jgi:MAF protein
VQRLAREKAEAVAKQYSDACIIGADQVGMLNDTVLCKPLIHETAVEQLKFISGKTVQYYIGMTVMNMRTHSSQTVLETFAVTYRKLDDHTIDNYLKKENPLNCAGSLKIEGLGIALVEKLSGDDYTALIGLPMMRLVTLLKKENIEIP